MGGSVFDDLIRFHTPEGKRAARAGGGIEHYLDEGAVMVAFAMHLLRTVPDLKHVSIHPDGMHGKTFDFAAWLRGQRYELTKPKGTTPYGGLYASADGRTVQVYSMPGLGDVVGGNITAECKGGVLNSTYAGQTSKLRKGLNETIGQSMTAEMVEGKRQFVADRRIVHGVGSRDVRDRFTPLASLDGFTSLVSRQLRLAPKPNAPGRCIRLAVRRFRCQTAACERWVFTERFSRLPVHLAVLTVISARARTG